MTSQHFTTTLLTITFIALLAVIGCSTDNPLCSDNWCIEGEIFAKDDLEDNEEWEAIPASVSEQDIINLLTVPTPGDFSPVTIRGTIDWDFRSTAWQYRENRKTYLKKVTIEPWDNGQFGENRTILVILNRHTLATDANFHEHVDFLGLETVRLTQWIDVGTFRGDILGAPTK